MANKHQRQRDFDRKKKEWAKKLKEPKKPGEPIGFDYELDPYGAPYYKKEDDVEEAER